MAVTPLSSSGGEGLGERRLLLKLICILSDRSSSKLFNSRFSSRRDMKDIAP
jgi:hypothetical protein